MPRPTLHNAPINSTQFRRAVQRVSNFALQLPQHIVQNGLDWYPSVHEAAASGGRDLGISTAQAAGIISAVSPNMDFEKRNIQAFGEIQSLSPEHWSMIEASARQPRVPSSTGRGTVKPQRFDEVSAMLSEVAPHLRHATDAHLLDARRILHGADFMEVFDPRTGPKRQRFARNILDPSDPEPVTIDGRQADIIADRYRPWNWSGRGISSANLPSGKSTRYEDYEEVMRRSAVAVGRQDHFMSGINGATLQAITWVGGQAHERAWPTKSGEPRKKGVTRQGQRYSDVPRPGWLATPDAPR